MGRGEGGVRGGWGRPVKGMVQVDSHQNREQSTVWAEHARTNSRGGVQHSNGASIAQYTDETPRPSRNAVCKSGQGREPQRQAMKVPRHFQNLQSQRRKRKREETLDSTGSVSAVAAAMHVLLR